MDCSLLDVKDYLCSEIMFILLSVFQLTCSITDEAGKRVLNLQRYHCASISVLRSAVKCVTEMRSEMYKAQRILCRIKSSQPINHLAVKHLFKSIQKGIRANEGVA